MASRSKTVTELGLAQAAYFYVERQAGAIVFRVGIATDEGIDERTIALADTSLTAGNKTAFQTIAQTVYNDVLALDPAYV